MTRRTLLRSGVRAGLGTIAAPMINLGQFQLFAGTRRAYSTRAIDLITESTVVDMLSLLTMDWQKLDGWQAHPTTFTPADFQHVRNSKIDVFHPAVDLDSADPYTATREWLEHWNSFIAAEPDKFARIDTGSDIAAAKRAGKIGILLGVQNASHFRTAGDVGMFHCLGQRVSQLTYNSRNAIGCGCVDQPDDGLTEFGVSIIRAMNRVGMAIDVSHVGERTSLDAFEASTKPVLITHSNCRALVHHPRCKSDRVIKAMAGKGGVMGITGIRPFVSHRDSGSVADVLDHFDHVAKLVGVEHAGVGSDAGLDGRRQDVPGLNHTKRIFDLTEGLIHRGYSNHHIQLMLGANFVRVLNDAIGFKLTVSPILT